MAKGNVGGATVTRQKHVLTPEIIEDLKRRLVDNGFDDRIYKYTESGEDIVFRPLMHFDYQAIQSWMKTNEGSVNQDDVDRMICEKALVWPPEIITPVGWEVQKAGLQNTLAKQVLARSGFIVSDIDQSGYMSVEPLSTKEVGPKPDDKVIQELKAKYNWSLYLVEFEDEFFVVRPISRAEWRAITNSGNADVELVTAEKATVWSKEYPEPCDFSSRIAGVARTITDVCWSYSGFDQTKVVVEEL